RSGSLSAAAPAPLALALPRLGARSPCGAGGAAVPRFARAPPGAWRRRALPPVASARFGVPSPSLPPCPALPLPLAPGAPPG
ncbi:glutamate synthase-related protein, partial [Mycobacterium tuberculosis]|uniref:glutamate synthase-related protein n=1 Tax=Mycobacterium tuberculosis TaxID=1773 RepID=UPI0011580B97